MKIDSGLLGAEIGQVVRQARELEEAGFDGCFTFEGPHEPFLSLLLAAEHTNLEVGTGLAVAFARTPMTVANIAHDLQHFAGGRLWLGLGSQIRPHIEARYGMPWSKPVSRMKEFIGALRAIWRAWERGEKLDFRGDFYTHTLMPPIFNPGPAEGGSPPIYLGGVGPKMTEAAGEVADGMLLHPFHTENSLQQVTLPAVERGLESAGRTLDDFRLSAQVIIVTGRDDAERERALAMARNQIAFYASTPAYRSVLEAEGKGELQPTLRAMTKEGRWGDMASAIDDELLQAIAVIGTPKEIANTLTKRYADLASRIAFASPFPIASECSAEIIERFRESNPRS
ncbi:MAG: TIGR03617 family F420-dependent LLM class oxidoreductase [Polyangiales bacterium]